MREDLLGLELERARAVLAREGIQPRVILTSAPRRAPGGVLRVIHAADDGSVLTAAGFFDPVADGGKESEE